VGDRVSVVVRSVSTSTGLPHTSPVVTLAGDTLTAADRFCSLGSIISCNASIGDEVNARLAKASAAFGRLTKCLWNEHGVRLSTKVAVDRAVMLTTLLFGSETNNISTAGSETGQLLSALTASNRRHQVARQSSEHSRPGEMQAACY